MSDHNTDMQAIARLAADCERYRDANSDEPPRDGWTRDSAWADKIANHLRAALALLAD